MPRQRTEERDEQCEPKEPVFLYDNDPNDGLPPIVLSINIRELYRWQPEERLDEAIAGNLIMLKIVARRLKMKDCLESLAAIAVELIST